MAVVPSFPLSEERVLIKLTKLIRKATSIVIAVLLVYEAQILVIGGVAYAQDPTNKLTTQRLAQSEFLARVLYSQPSRVANNIGDDGAIVVNRQVGAGERMYIEEQRYGGDLVQMGLATGDDSLVRLGLKVIEWGFRQQAQDGSFPQTGDAFHSVSMFVEGTARAFLSLCEAGGSQYANVTTEMTPRLVAAARWLQQPDVERTGRSHDAPYTHRRWILAAALGQTAALTRDADMALRAQRYAEDGLAQQLDNGVNPEKGGYDVSYQAVGILHAEHYFVVCHDNELKARVKRMIERAANWELTMITNDGQVLVGDSTRVGNETSRSGKVKKVNTKELLQALSYATTIIGDKKYRDKAALVARAHNWH